MLAGPRNTSIRAPQVVENDHAMGTTLGQFQILMDKLVMANELDTVRVERGEGCDGH